jgi:hypothetical protein
MPDDPGVTRVRETRCLNCGKRLDAVGTSDGSPGQPEDGDPVACIKCGEVMAFDGSGGLRGFTEAEIEELIKSPVMDELARLTQRIHFFQRAKHANN